MMPHLFLKNGICDAGLYQRSLPKVFTPFNISNADPEGRHLLMLLGNCYFSPINRLYILIILPEGRIVKYNRRLKGEKVYRRCHKELYLVGFPWLGFPILFSMYGEPLLEN